MELRKLREDQLDGLREVASIGSGHIATALSQLIKRRVWVTVPRVRVASLEQVATLISPLDVVAGVLTPFLGDITGRAMVVFAKSETLHLVDILLSRERGETKLLSELESSAFKEVSSILTCSYLTALSNFLGFLILPSVPNMAVDLAPAILTSLSVNMRDSWDCVICMDTEFDFEEEGEPLRGYFLLLPNPESLASILRALRLE